MAGARAAGFQCCTRGARRLLLFLTVTHFSAEPFAALCLILIGLCLTVALPLPAPRRVLAECQLDASEALRLQAAVGYGLEDTQMIIESMAQVGEGTGGRAAGR